MAMLVKDLMKTNLETCTPDTNLETVATLMWNHDCGAIPVVDDSGKLAGIVTDRDIAIGCSLNHKPLWDMTAADVVNHRPVYSCHADDGVDSLLHLMEEHQVRRIPVIDEQGSLQGIVAMGDAIQASRKTAGKGHTSIPYDQLMTTLKAISLPQHLDHQLVKAG